MANGLVSMPSVGGHLMRFECVSAAATESLDVGKSRVIYGASAIFTIGSPTNEPSYKYISSTGLLEVTGHPASSTFYVVVWTE